VGSLIFFLLEVLYVGQYSGRMQWTLFFFVFGIVLIARISIEQGGGRAMLYGIGMAIVVWLALQAFIEYPAGSPMKALSWASNFASRTPPECGSSISHWPPCRCLDWAKRSYPQRTLAAAVMFSG